MKNLLGKTVFITGASRGIGREIALRFARDGANVAIVAKTAEPHPILEGTIYSVAKEVEEVGAKALPLQADVRNEDQVTEAIKKTAHFFGGIDFLINNAGAISLTSTEDTSMKRYDLMQDINVRSVFLCSKMAIPFLKNAKNPHILNLSPPISLKGKWLAPHVAYSISKYGMTLLTIGLAQELAAIGIGVNSLWPKTIINTAAINFIMGSEGLKQTRKPTIVADAAYYIVTSSSKTTTGNTFIDEEVLKSNGVQDFSAYSVEPGAKLMNDLFID